MTKQDKQRGDPETGMCYVCGETLDSQLELSQHLTDVDEEDVLRPAGPDEQVPGSESGELAAAHTPSRGRPVRS
jgi:hypothetical protein